MRILAVLTLLPLLAGCSDSDWNRLLSFNGSEQAATQPVAVATVAPPAASIAPPASTTGAPITQAQAAAALNPLCLGVARDDAMTNDFDVTTQQKVAARSYQQCQQIFGN